ncbi:MAG: N-acetyl-gamma-glutamyl-phosphate reductase [Persicimonas sp.]
MATMGIVGARGYAGAELIGLVGDHADFELAYVGSRKLAGELVSEHVAGYRGQLRYEKLTPEEVAERPVDVCVLALPNEVSQPFVDAIDARAPGTVIIDLSSDHRFDDAWTYGQPERFRDEIREARRIANPGCYATGIQLGLAPLVELAVAPPQVFGVSGYSGAGTKPSPKNDTDLLEDNLMPYKLVGHTHEREVTRHLGHQVYFSPHVAPFFRGITLTLSVQLARPTSKGTIVERLEAAYGDEPLVEVTDEETPLVKDNAGRHLVRIGGVSVDQSGVHLAFVVTLDNLLKGAATQALQNANLVCDFDELEGIR